MSDAAAQYNSLKNNINHMEVKRCVPWSNVSVARYLEVDAQYGLADNDVGTKAGR